MHTVETAQCFLGHLLLVIRRNDTSQDDTPFGSLETEIAPREIRVGRYFTVDTGMEWLNRFLLRQHGGMLQESGLWGGEPGGWQFAGGVSTHVPEDSGERLLSGEGKDAAWVSTAQLADAIHHRQLKQFWSTFHARALRKSGSARATVPVKPIVSSPKAPIARNRSS